MKENVEGGGFLESALFLLYPAYTTMLSLKRVLVATVSGFVCGLICMFLASSNPDPAAALSTAMLLTILISRTLTGFTIGISALPLQWWLHGPAIFLLGSIPMALPVLDRPAIAVGTVVMGLFYGLFVEFVTTVLLKAPPVARMRIVKSAAVPA